MTDRNSVRDILYRAGAEGASLTAARAYSSPAQGVSVILGHLEDCVLPRRLDLGFDGGARIALEVAERQVLRLCAAELPAGSASSLPPGALASEDAGALAELLLAVCRRAGSVRITSNPADDADAAAGGVSMAALRLAAGVPGAGPRKAGTTTWIEALVEHDRIDVLSAVLIDVDEAHVVKGSKDEAEALADWAVEMLDVFLADSFPLAPELETKGAVTFAPQQNGCHVLLAGLRGQFLLALVSGPDCAATLGAWQGVADREVDGLFAVQ